MVPGNEVLRCCNIWCDRLLREDVFACEKCFTDEFRLGGDREATVRDCQYVWEGNFVGQDLRNDYCLDV